MAIEMPTTFTTDTGVEFHLEENATNHASKLGLKGVRVWRTHIATYHRYTVLDRNTPIYEAQSLDDIEVFLDLMAYVERSP